MGLLDELNHTAREKEKARYTRLEQERRKREAALKREIERVSKLHTKKKVAQYLRENAGDPVCIYYPLYSSCYKEEWFYPVARKIVEDFKDDGFYLVRPKSGGSEGDCESPDDWWGGVEFYLKKPNDWR